ncbi:hypothetical protein GCM10027440_09880 [Nocardiopsis coralliicola]
MDSDAVAFVRAEQVPAGAAVDAQVPAEGSGLDAGEGGGFAVAVQAVDAAYLIPPVPDVLLQADVEGPEAGVAVGD